MDLTTLKIFQTAIAIIVYLVLRLVIRKTIDRTIAKSILQKARGKVLKKSINILLLLTFCIFIFTFWGVDQSELMLFIGSILTVIGIALVAQWSILSNITSGIILFFNHSIRLEDTITIIDKDYEVEGRVSDIGLFFVLLKTKKGEEVSIPNSVLIQKMIKKKQSV